MIVTISALLVDGTYLIDSELSYQDVPTVCVIMAKTGIALSDDAYTDPQQSACALYIGIDTTACPRR